VVAAVDGLRAPSLTLEACVDPTRPVIGRGHVVHDDDRQSAQAEPAGELHGLPVAALVELGVANEADDARRRLPSRAQRERHAHGDRQRVTKRAAGDLDARWR
jgi:hypothetical protein